MQKYYIIPYCISRFKVIRCYTNTLVNHLRTVLGVFCEREDKT